MNIRSNQFTSIQQVTGAYLKQDAEKKSQEEIQSFQKVFQHITDTQKTDVVFSKHANERLEKRNIKLSKEQIDRLNDGVENARKKEIRASLVMVDGYSFIVNIKNNIVVTALDGTEEQKVFTNIDGAVIS